jgi:predicted nucleic acid-binding protein
MTLVDTSVWIDFLRGSASAAWLAELLADDRVLTHPWIIGELALGNLGKRRASILLDLGRLPTTPTIDSGEVRAMIEVRKLSGSGIGWVDAQLLASALVAGCNLWTRDKSLATICREIGIG